MVFRWSAACLVLTGLAACPSASRAEPITYTEQAVASGSLGSQDFTDTLLRVTLTADTSSVTGTPGGVFGNIGQAYFTLGSGGPVAILDPLTVFAFTNAAGTILGLSDLSQFADLLDTSVSAVVPYDLTTAIGPLFGASLVSPAVFFATGAGDLDLLSAGESRFSASLQDVPEPASMAVLCGGAVLLMASQAGRRKSAY